MTLLVAIGNTLRRDDGAAHRVLELLELPAGVESISCHQLTPEMSEEIAAADTVVFIDADVNPGPAQLEPLEPGAGLNPLGGHFLQPQELLAIAQRLFAFRGEAWLCHVPGVDFGDGEGLSPMAEANARAAAQLIRQQIGPSGG
jgi:hydrogenase maturation protease